MDGSTSELTCEGNKEDMGDLELFTCQRGMVYIRKKHIYCARTDVPWPFSNIDYTPFSPEDLSSNPVTPLSLPPEDSHDESSNDHHDQPNGWIQEGLNGSLDNSDHAALDGEVWSSCSSEEVASGGNREENQEKMEDEVEQGNGQVSPQSELQEASSSGIGTGPWSSSVSDRDDGEGMQSSAGDEGSCSWDMEGSEMDQATAEAAGDVLDEFTAYEHDILLVSVKHDDSELFQNLPEENADNRSLPTMQSDASVEGPTPDVPQNSRAWRIRRDWRPQESSPTEINCVDEPDANNNHVDQDLERNQLVQRVNFEPDPEPSNDACSVNSASAAKPWTQKRNAYCRQFFSESMSCPYKTCWFRHAPLDGDEKFCIDTVIRFTNNLLCLHKAASVFTVYYSNNAPGEHFSTPVFHTLLWALLKANMVAEVLSVLDVSSTYRIMPNSDFLLALFNVVREKSLTSFFPGLMQLVLKMVSAGLTLSLDCLDCVKSTSSAIPAGTPPLHDLILTHGVLEVELCSKSKDWRQMGAVLKSVCKSSQRFDPVEKISTRIAMALLSDGTDKLPFSVFAETVCVAENIDCQSMSFFGRIGVSLMLRYHKTHQWAKGRTVVETLSNSKVCYSMLRSLFEGDDGVSRGCVITVATELFLLSGSVEGALNTLRENNWFLSSCQWQCNMADVESRIRVLIRLAENSSPRDVLDILRNLPGLKESCELVDISRYTPLLNSQLQVFLDKNVLPLATDTVNLMHCKKLAVDQIMLQMLLYKLGKQNLWLQARQVFRQSLRAGYYQGVCAPSSLMTLTVPCQLGEMELALTLELFITVNAAVVLNLPETTSQCLTVTLKRTQSTEMDYLSASNRLMSAAHMAQPQLSLLYKAVNSLQEQVFTLDISTAQCWLRHNHFWAIKLWEQ